MSISTGSSMVEAPNTPNGIRRASFSRPLPPVPAAGTSHSNSNSIDMGSSEVDPDIAAVRAAADSAAGDMHSTNPQLPMNSSWEKGQRRGVIPPHLNTNGSWKRDAQIIRSPRSSSVNSASLYNDGNNSPRQQINGGLNNNNSINNNNYNNQALPEREMYVSSRPTTPLNSNSTNSAAPLASAGSSYPQAAGSSYPQDGAALQQSPAVGSPAVGSPAVGSATVGSATGTPRSSQQFSNSPNATHTQGGLMHSLKKAFNFHHPSSSPHVADDPVINDAYRKMEGGTADLRRLQSSLYQYEQLRQQFALAFQSVAQDFHRCFQDPQHPYASLANQLVQLQSEQQSHLQALSMMPLVEQVDQLSTAFEQDQTRVRKQLDNRNVKSKDVQYYLGKVEKLQKSGRYATHGNEAVPSPRTHESGSKLDRNVAKYEHFQSEYNRENEQLVSTMNQAWKNRSLSLGPILVHFIQQRGAYENQMQHIAKFQNQIADPANAQQQEQWHRHYSQNAQLIPNNAGIISQEPQVMQQIKERQMAAGGMGQGIGMNHGMGVGMGGNGLGMGMEKEQEVSRMNDASLGGKTLESNTELARPSPHQLSAPLFEQILWSEQIRYHKESFLRERIHLRKYYTTEIVTLQVPVRREKVDVEREIVESSELTRGDSSMKMASLSGNDLNGVPRDEQALGKDGVSEWDRMKDSRRNSHSRLVEDSGRHTSKLLNTLNGHEQEEVVIVVNEERPRVVLDWVAVERVVVKKRAEQMEQTIVMDLRKEEVQLDQTQVRALPMDPIVLA